MKFLPVLDVTIKFNAFDGSLIAGIMIFCMGAIHLHIQDFGNAMFHMNFGFATAATQGHFGVRVCPSVLHFVARAFYQC